MVTDLLEDGLLRVGKGGDRELEAWAREQAGGEETDPRLCHVCGEREGRRRCQACEKPVCAADSWSMFGLCRRCATPERIAAWNRRREAQGGNWLEDA